MMRRIERVTKLEAMAGGGRLRADAIDGAVTRWANGEPAWLSGTPWQRLVDPGEYRAALGRASGMNAALLASMSPIDLMV